MNEFFCFLYFFIFRLMKRSIYTNMNGNKIDFSIGLENVKSIPFQNYENNFTFFVNGKQYKTNRFIADLLSPKIRNYHFSDQSIDKFDIDISNLRDDIDSLKKQYAIYQQKKKERELAAMTQHAKKSPARSQKSKTSVTPSPKKKTGKK